MNKGEKILVGYAEDYSGATRKFQIIGRAFEVDSKGEVEIAKPMGYVVKDYPVETIKLDGEHIWLSNGGLSINSHLTNIHEETLGKIYLPEYRCHYCGATEDLVPSEWPDEANHKTVHTGWQCRDINVCLDRDTSLPAYMKNNAASVGAAHRGSR